MGSLVTFREHEKECPDENHNDKTRGKNQRRIHAIAIGQIKGFRAEKTTNKRPRKKRETPWS